MPSSATARRSRSLRSSDLMRSDDPLFRRVMRCKGRTARFTSPHALCRRSNRRTDGGGKHGRIYRLSWGGTADLPAIPLRRSIPGSRSRLPGEDQLTAPAQQRRVRAQRRRRPGAGSPGTANEGHRRPPSPPAPRRSPTTTAGGLAVRAAGTGRRCRSFWMPRPSRPCC